MVRLSCFHLLLYNFFDFSGVIKLMLVLPDTTVRSQGCWHPSAWDLPAGTNEFTPQTCLEIHYVPFGVPEGRIWPGKAAEKPDYVDGCRHLPFMNFRCLVFAAFSLWVASLLHCLNKCFPVLYRRTSGSLLRQEPLDLLLLA